MSKNINIFNYAKKELSQDAFLMWLLDSYDSNDLNEKETSIDFINFLVELKSDEIIKKVDVKPQWCKIDVTAYITTNYRMIGLFIEDKTSSSEHNQLIRYNEYINREKGKLSEIRKIFYKTNPIDEVERTRVIDAGWTEISFKAINSFWSKYLSADHLFIKQYAEHVCTLYRDSENIVIPSENNILAWKSFFSKVIVPSINDSVDCKVSSNRFGYAYLIIVPKGRLEEYMPYLELRSRDCILGEFNAKILMYDVDFSNNPDGLNQIRNEIWKNEAKGIFKGNYGVKKNKQVAHSPKGKFKYNNIDEFKKLILESIQEYLNIVSFWK